MTKNKIFALLALIPLFGLTACNDSAPTSSSEEPTVSTPESDETSVSSEPEKVWEEVKEDGTVKIVSVPDVVVGVNQDFTIELEWTGTTQYHNMKVALESSDESLLPLSAIETSLTGVDGTVSTGASVSIDPSSLTQTGVVYLEMKVTSTNSSSWGGTVVAAIDLVSKDSIEYTYLDENIAISVASGVDFNLEAGETLIIQITDKDHINGIPNPNGEEGNTYNWFQMDFTSVVESDEPFSFSFKYAEGHDYTVMFSIRKPDGYYRNGTFTVEDVDDAKASYDAKTGAISFTEANQTLTLEITDFQA